MVALPGVAFVFCASAKSFTPPIPLGHAQQLIAAALGHKSLAAYQASDFEIYSLDVAEHYVLDMELLEQRVLQLDIRHPFSDVAALVQKALISCLPGTEFHDSEAGLQTALELLVKDCVSNSGRVSGRIAETNGEGLDELYLPVEFELAPLAMREITYIPIEGHVSVRISDERPYCGHKINVEALLSIERTGKCSVGELDCQILSAEMDDWGGKHKDDVPKVPLAQVFAEELGLTLDEAEQLIDVEPIENDDGLSYSLIFDFTGTGTPNLQEKLLRKHGSLQLELSQALLDQVDW